MSKDCKYQKGATSLFDLWLNSPCELTSYVDVRAYITNKLTCFTYKPSKRDLNVLSGILYRKIKKHGIQPK